MMMADGLRTGRQTGGPGRTVDQRRRPGPQRHALAGGPAPGARRPGVRRAMGGGGRRQRIHRRQRRGGPAVGRQHDACSVWSTRSGVSGAPAARNAGVRAAGGELLAFCDADDVVAAGWLGLCVQASARPTWWPGSSTSGRSTGSRLASVAGRHPAARLPAGRAGGQPGRSPAAPSTGRRVRRGAARSARTSTCAGACSSEGSGSHGHRRRGGQARAARVRAVLPPG